MNSIRPSKRLTDFLTTYFEFDSNQLSLGLWSGDLKIQNVNLRKEAFDPLLNDWKDKDANIDLAAFLSKEIFVDKEPSFSSLVNLKLIDGTIGYCRATVPWKNLLLGAGDNVVQIELRDVTIRLRFESCMARELQSKHGGFANFHANSKKRVKFGRLRGDERRWKQEMIRIAEKYHGEKKDIPTPAEFEKLKNDFFSRQNRTGPEEDTEDVQSTYLQQFVRSFASSVGWRVGNGLKASMRNIQIIMVQDGIEVGVHTDTIQIGEYGYEEDESGISTEEGSARSATNSPVRVERKRHGDSLIPERDLSKDECIRKKLSVSNCGVFVKKVSQDQSSAVEPVLDEYIVQPSNASVYMCLRKTGITVDKVEEEKPQVQDEVLDETMNEYSESTIERKSRRGKREKRLKLEDDEEDRSIDSEQRTEFEEITIPGGNGNAAVTEGPSTPHSQSSFGGMDVAESSALFSTEVRLDRVVVVPTTRSINLLSIFLTRVSQIKQGRPYGDLKDFGNAPIEKKIFCKQLMYYSLLNGVLKDVMRRKALENYFAKIGEDFHTDPYRRKSIDIYSDVRTSFESLSNEEIDRNSNKEKKKYLRILEDSLPVEQLVLYRALAIKGTSAIDSFPELPRPRVDKNVSIPDIFSFEIESHSFSRFTNADTPPTSPEQVKRHRTTKSLAQSLALVRSDSGRLTTSRKAPKHQRRQSLNIDTMNDALGFIPSGRQHRYTNSDLSAIVEGGSFEEGSVRGNLETMYQFDSVLMGDEQLESTTKTITSEPLLDAQQTISVSFSVTFALSELKLFLCVDKACAGLRNSCTSDEMSMASTFSFDEYFDSDDDAAGERGLRIFGTNHTIVLSATLLKTRMYVYNDLRENVKVTALSIDAAICKARNIPILQTGRIPHSMVGAFSNSPARDLKPQGIGDLIDYHIWDDLDSSLPFLRAKIRKKSLDASDSPIMIQVSLGKISVLVDFAILQELKGIADVFSNRKCVPFVASLSGYDCIRYKAAKSLVQSVPKQNLVDLLVQVEGFVVEIPIIDDERVSCLERIALCKTSLGKIECRQGSFLKESMACKVVTDFPTTSFHNTVSATTCLGHDFLNYKSNIFVPQQNSLKVCRVSRTPSTFRK